MKAPAKPSPADIIVTPEGITVYPPLNEDGCWRAVWYEPDGRRRFSSARDEAGLATKLEPVRRRLVADAEHTEDLGSDLVAHYLSPDRHSIDRRWSPSHLSKQRRYCENYILPVIGKIRCDKIRVSQMQAAVNAPNTADAGRRVAKTVAAMVKLGIKDGYLTNPRLGMVHWQPGDREIPAPNVRVAGQNADFVEIAEIPGHDDVDALGTAMLDSRRAPWWRQLMPYVSAYSGLRIGELLSLGAEDVHADDRTLAVTWQVIEVDGKLLRVPPKGGKRRTTVYPVSTFIAAR